MRASALAVITIFTLTTGISAGPIRNHEPDFISVNEEYTHVITRRSDTIESTNTTANATEVPEICMQPAVKGDCKAWIKRYCYVPKKMVCLTFTYSGCGGNENNFKTLDDCKQACQRSP